jgi:hypothetical protein
MPLPTLSSAQVQWVVDQVAPYIGQQPEFYKVFSVHDAQLYEEKYNLLNAFLATIPGNLAGLVSTGVEG